nr:unnamed protein product [Callosobruchus chinensis]CAH7767354.1 unnamed protein product [Callosobruchus chinensis]
MLQGLVGALPA